MIRFPYVVACVLTSMVSVNAFAQSSAGSASVTLQAGFDAQAVQVQAKGEHNVADSATLRARGCEGFVATEPALAITYDDKQTGGSIVVRAESPTDLVMLIGTASNAWFCADDVVGTNPEITLPAGSGSFSVWVGTAQKGTARSTVTIRESQGARAPQVSGRCGASSARIPESIASDDWSRFTCMPQADAGTRWDACYGRPTYSDFSRDGCPGAERCCPYEGFDLAKSQARASGAAAVAPTPARTATPTPARPATPPPAPTTPVRPATPATPIQPEVATPSSTPSSAATQNPQGMLLVHTTPFGTRAAQTVVYWRGFASAAIPVHSETRSDAPVLYSLEGNDFPRPAQDSLLVVKQTRRLKARHAASLSSPSGAIAIAAGKEIELLGALASNECQIRIDGRILTASCPTLQDFDGVGSSFSGLSPLAYEWWIAVENDARQRGWVRIDLSRPEFVVALPPGR